MKMSIREAGASAGAAGFEAVLVESWAKRLIELSPTAPATSRIRPSEVKGRECMRLSSATTGKSFINLEVVQQGHRTKTGRGSSHNSNSCRANSDRWMQNSHIR